MIKKKTAATSATKTASSSRTTKTKESSDLTKSKSTQVSINTVLKSKVRFKFRTIKQREFSDLIDDKEIVVAYGPAGTGKSLISIAKGLELLQADDSKYKQLIIVKPAVEAEESLGFLKGSLEEKMEPHIASSMDIVDKLVSEPTRINLVDAKIIRVEPLSFIRGKTFSDSVLVFEESQNVSPNQMKTILTRIGENSKYIISGDLDQSDKYRNVKESGLYDLIQRHKNIEEIGFFEFGEGDIVRNPLITKILKNYEKVDTKINKKELLIEDELLEKRVQKRIDESKIIKTKPIIIKENVLGGGKKDNKLLNSEYTAIDMNGNVYSKKTMGRAVSDYNEKLNEEVLTKTNGVLKHDPLSNREKLNEEIVLKSDTKGSNWLTKLFTTKNK
jgi:phosphate starvation-inducible protein PhoH